MAVYRTVTANATLSDNTVQAEGTVSDEIAEVTAVSQSVQPIVSSDYADLTNKPEINSHTLEGNQSSADLGLAPAEHTHTKSQITDLSKMLTKVAASGGNGEISLTNSYSDGSFDSSVVELSGYVDNASYSNGTLKLKRKNLLPNITVFTADSSPTSGSGQLVTSGGVYTALASKADTSHTHTKSQITDFPTNVSAFTNDAGYLTSYTETDPVFTASVAHGITSTDVTNWNNKGTYSKPSGGIPKTDLASAVQASLGKADTALQSYTETDPVFTASAAHGITSSDITAWNNKSDFSGSYNDLTDVPASFTPSAHSHNLADVTDVTASASEVNILDGATIPTADLNQAYQGIPYGNVTSDSTTVFTATVPGVTALKDGTCCLIRNNNKQNSASGWTLNVNDLGAKPVYNNMADASRETTIFNKVYTMLFVYDEDRVDGGCWICYKGYDSNTNTIGYQLRTNSTVMNVSDTARYYKLYFMSADNTKWVPASVNSTNSATSAKTVNQRPINPFGRIVYTSANTNYTAGSNLAATTIWDQYVLSLGYSFNRTGVALTMTVEAPVYVKCAPQSDGSAIMDATTPIVQALPSTADGKIYIYLGVAYSAVNIELVPHHPVYYHDGTAIRLWTGAMGVTSVNGTTGAVTGLQTTSNLVTSISSSSTDVQYPSAKCVYDAIANAGGGGSANILFLYSDGYNGASTPVYIDSAKTTKFADYYDSNIKDMAAVLKSADLIYVYTYDNASMYTKFLINKILYDSIDETLYINSGSTQWYLI